MIVFSLRLWKRERERERWMGERVYAQHHVHTTHTFMRLDRTHIHVRRNRNILHIEWFVHHQQYNIFVSRLGNERAPKSGGQRVHRFRLPFPSCPHFSPVPGFLVFVPAYRIMYVEIHRSEKQTRRGTTGTGVRVRESPLSSFVALEGCFGRVPRICTLAPRCSSSVSAGRQARPATCPAPFRRKYGSSFPVGRRQRRPRSHRLRRSVLECSP